jgi:predicted transcriptional regulator
MRRQLIQILTFALCFTGMIAHTNAQSWLWASSGGGSTLSNGSDGTYGVDVDASGNTYSCGVYTGGPFTLGSTNYNSAVQNIWVGKQDANGNWLWAKESPTLAANQFMRAYALKVDNNGDVIVAGVYQGTFTWDGQSFDLGGSTEGQHAFIMKLSAATGSIQWVYKIYNSNSPGISNGMAEIFDLHIDASNNIFASGRYIRTIKFGASNGPTLMQLVSSSTFEGFFVKLNNAGTYQFAKRVDSGSQTTVVNNKILYGITTDASGNIYTVGYTTAGILFNNAISVTNTSLYNNTFVAKWNSAGTATGLWMVGGSTNNHKYAYDIMVLANGNLAICGMEDRKATVLQLNPSTGATVSTLTPTTNQATGNICQFYAMDQDNLGNIYVTGYLNDLAGSTTFGTFTPANTNQDIILCKISSTNTWTWVQTLGSSSTTLTNEFGRSIAVVGNDEFALGGFYSASMVFNSGPSAITLTAAGNNDLFVARYGVCQTPAISGQPSNVSACTGASIPALSVTATGNASYQWQSLSGTWSNISGATSNSYTPTASGTYRVVVSGCSTSLNSNQVTVTINAAPSVTISGGTLSCGAANVALSTSGGTYLWSNGATTSSITVAPSSTTTYNVTVTAANGCSGTDSHQVTAGSVPTVAASPFLPNICPGGSTSITGTGATSYSWSTGGAGTAIVVNPASTTTYSVTGTNAAGCTATASATVTVNTPTAVISGTPTVCASQTPTVLTASGGVTYAWSSGATTPSISVLPVSNLTFTVTSTDAQGCTAVASQLVTVNSAPSASVAGTNSVCAGTSTTLTASGGDTYLWSNGATGASISVSPANNTTYTVTVTNANGCTATANRAVTVNAVPTASVSGNNTICAGATTSLTANGGTAYTWSNGATSASISISPGSTTTYTVTVSNASACTATATRTVTVNAAPNASVSGTNTICPGASTNLTASGGTSYAWSNNATGASISVSPASTTTYSVTVTDGNGCTATANRTVTVNAAPSANVSGTNTICDGASTSLTASGGTSYAWSNSATGASISVSPSTTTTYTVTVTNAAGCTATATRTVTVNALPTAAINGPTSICTGLNATLTASGGTSYLWSNAATSAAITVSPASTTSYTVTVTNAAGCTATANQSVQVNTTPVASITGNTAVCQGESLTLSANGGNSYTWSNGSTTASITVNPGTSTSYSVTVSLGGSCTATASQSVTVNTNPSASITGNNSICEGTSTTLSATGGTSYVWSGAQNTATITVSPTATSTYTVTVTNAAGCTATANRTVTVNTNPSAAISGNNTVCLGASTSLTASGGNAYAWSTGGNSATVNVSPTSNTNYSVTVTDANACTATATYSVTVNALPSVSVVGNSNLCAGETTTLTASGGTNYAWSNGGNAAAITVSPTSNTTYTVTATDANGCTASNTQSVVVNALPTPSINGNLSVCEGSSTTLIATGNATFVWDNGQTNASITVSPSTLTNYSLTATDANGCTASTQVTVVVNQAVQSSPTVSICVGETFSFDGQNLSVAGVYTATLSNINGCDSVVTLSLTVNALPNPTVTLVGNELSTSTFDTYQWYFNGAIINGATSQNYTPTQNGDYTVEVSNANGCVAISAMFNVTFISVEAVQNASWMLYPNPTTGLVYLKNAPEGAVIRTLNATGQVIFESMIEHENSTIDLSAMPAGVYHIQVGNTYKHVVKD